MRPPPLSDRVMAALALAPMSVSCLARALSASRGAVRHQVALAVCEGRIERVSTMRQRSGRPAAMYGMRA